MNFDGLSSDSQSAFDLVSMFLTASPFNISLSGLRIGEKIQAAKVSLSPGERTFSPDNIPHSNPGKFAGRFFQPKRSEPSEKFTSR